jgi:hypothetical protein
VFFCILDDFHWNLSYMQNHQEITTRRNDFELFGTVEVLLVYVASLNLCLRSSSIKDIFDINRDGNVQVQLIRIELRVPEYGWTTQKVFHLLNFIVNGGAYSATHMQVFCHLFFLLMLSTFVFLCCIAVRAAVFCFREDVQALNPEVCLNEFGVIVGIF